LQEKFRADPQKVADEYEFEQRFVTRNAPGGPKFFPRRFVLHFRQDCRWPFPLNYFLAPWLPADARVIIFPRGLLPQHAIDGQFGYKGRPATPLGHIRGLFSPERRKKTPSVICATTSSRAPGWRSTGASDRRAPLTAVNSASENLGLDAKRMGQGRRTPPFRSAPVCPKIPQIGHARLQLGVSSMCTRS
jgi:hypothetical protein